MIELKENIEYIDINNLDCLPNVPKNKRYLEFIGGTKKYRCFIVDDNYSRWDFYNEHLELIDKVFHPIYKNRDILVTQDNNFAVPAFYKISYNKQYNYITELPDSLIIRTNNLIKYIRKIMFEQLNIKYVSVYCEEGQSSNIYFWIIPNFEIININDKKYNISMKNEFKDFNIEETRKKIIKFNNKIRKELIKINYKKIDDELYNKIEIREKKINLCIAKYCFIKCKGCYNNFCNKNEISYKEIIRFLKYAKNNGLQKVTLSGGDPLTRNDLKKIIRKCNNLKLKINLDTVGLTFTKSCVIPSTKRKVNKISNLKFLRKINTVGIPLDGSNNEIISKFRIYNGNLFNEIIEELDLFDKLNINICVNTVLHKQNKNDIENIYNILIKHKCVKKWQIFQFMPIGPLGSKNSNLYVITNEEFQSVKKRIEKINKDKKIIIDLKSSKERAYNYMLVNSNGLAYKVDLNNEMEQFGNISDDSTWDNILKNLF